MINSPPKIIHIAIDGNEANVINRVGSNVYAYFLLKELFELADAEKHSMTVLLTKPPLGDMPPERKYWRYQIVTPSQFWTWWALPIYLHQHQSEFDVFFTPGHYAPRLCPIPYVSSVMDLAFLEYPDMFKLSDLIKLKLWTKLSVGQAQKVITISRYSQLAIHKHYNLPLTNIVVAPPALANSTQVRRTTKSRKLLSAHRIQPPFILYLGTIQPRKNLVTLIKAYNLLRKKWTSSLDKSLGKSMVKKSNAPPQLVLAGKIGWLADRTLAQIRHSPYQQDILLTGFVTEPEKNALLSWASCTVQIGLYEGFGIPVLESLSAGAIPVVANTTSLPEAVGKAGLLVDPQDKKGIAQALLTACTLPVKKRAEYRQLGHKQLANFSWRSSAQTVLKTLWDVVASNKLVVK
ncbi:glycosyltransferase family 4 protein [Patescibacteria group bacterium]|nr:glycosyltransferase family 4 protein [Patescibacteria group bacterium]